MAGPKLAGGGAAASDGGEITHGVTGLADQQAGYCTDDEADEPVFDDISDDVSFGPYLFLYLLSLASV